MPFLANMPKSEAKWSKMKASYMWGNKDYYLRRTKFAVYQLATTNVNLVMDYNGLGAPAGFPNASIGTGDIVDVIAYSIFACLLVSVVFSVAIFFELFWPEREESPLFQWCAELIAAATSVFQLAASIALTYVAVNNGLKINGVSAADEASIRASWDGPPLGYKNGTLLLAVLGFSWLQFIFVTWSVCIMWKGYAHNNKFGPFKDHERKTRNFETLSMEPSVAQV